MQARYHKYNPDQSYFIQKPVSTIEADMAEPFWHVLCQLGSAVTMTACRQKQDVLKMPAQPHPENVMAAEIGWLFLAILGFSDTSLILRVAL